jgi:AcrR family transcriptional regulator
MADRGAETGGLRERKKRATRRALSEAALRLALERGPERLTVEEISEAVGVSARTFFNYFTSKEQALLGDGPMSAQPERITVLVADADTVLDGLYQVILAGIADSADSREQIRMRWRLLELHPDLLPRLFAKMEDFREVLASAVAARVGAHPQDAYPQLMAGVTAATMQVSVKRWLAGHGDHPLEYHVTELFGLLRAELGAQGRAGAGPSGEQRARAAALSAETTGKP